MKSTDNPRIRFLAGIVTVAWLPAFSGCAVVDVGGAGISIGASAVRATGNVAGAAVDVASAAVHGSGSNSNAAVTGGTESTAVEP